jgi:RecB family endonuclease NucS
MEYYVDMGARKRAKEVIDFTDCIDEQQSFKEKLLKEALEKNPSVLEKGLRLVRGGRQFPTDVSNINLLMQDKNKHYVVVELKKSKTEDGVVGQTLRYMGWVRENLSKAKVVRGIIIVAKGEITNKLKMAIKGLQAPQELIKLKEVPITIGDIRDVNSDVVSNT